MKIAILMILFVPLIALCLKQEKWYLYLFVALYPILPERFAIEISSSLPLLTASRLLIILILVMSVIKGRISWNIPQKLTIYIVVSIMISLVNLLTNKSEINKIINVLLGQFFIIVVLRDVIETEEEIEKCIDFILLASVILAVIGILQSVAKIDVTTALELVEARSKTELTERMGMVRASATYNAITYGCYCSFMCILGIYKYANTKKLRYIVTFVINIIALCLTLSRSSIVPLAIVLLYIFIKHFKEYKKMIIVMVPFLCIGIASMFILTPSIVDTFKETIKSVMVTLGFDVEMSSNFGLNANASTSRLVQFSAIKHMFMEGGLLIGLGYQAFISGKIYYWYPQFGHWTKATTLDVGVVGIVAESGIVGLLNWILFFGSIYLSTRKSGKFDFSMLMRYFIILYFVLNLLTSCANAEFFWIIICLYFAYDKICNYNVNQSKEIKNERVIN